MQFCLTSKIRKCAHVRYTRHKPWFVCSQVIDIICQLYLHVSYHINSDENKSSSCTCLHPAFTCDRHTKGYVSSGIGLGVELITRLEEIYRLWCVVLYDLETSRMSSWPALGRSAIKKIPTYYKLQPIFLNYLIIIFNPASLYRLPIFCARCHIHLCSCHAKGQLQKGCVFS